MNAHRPARRARRAGVTLLWCAALLALTAAPLHTRGQSQPTPIADYWLRIDETLAAVQRLNDLPRSQRQPALAALADQLLAIDQVALADGQVLAVDHSALARTMTASASNLDRVEAQLATLLAAQASWPEARHGAGDLAPLQTVLRRAEFQTNPKQSSRLSQWWQELLQRIEHWLARLLPESAVEGGVSVLNTALNLVGAAALLALLAFTANQLLTNLAAEAHMRADGGDGGPPLTADNAFRRAQELAEGQDYRTAVRFLYLSSLLTLDERGLLRYDRSKTNRETLRHLASQPTLALHLREVVDIFDRVWYGYQPLDAAAYERYQAHVMELRRP